MSKTWNSTHWSYSVPIMFPACVTCVSTIPTVILIPHCSCATHVTIIDDFYNNIICQTSEIFHYLLLVCASQKFVLQKRFINVHIL